jgi:Ca2+-dependent lipid-binding protein
VIKCKNLMKTSDCPHINAYVKCALVSMNNKPNEYQRTPVHKNSSSPVFDQKFIFEINDYSDYAQNLQIALWHRNRNLK